MLTAGFFHKLKISRFTENGAYLIDRFEEEVLMPKRYVTDTMEVEDEVEVFVYHDSEDRLVAITDRPYATSGQIACLEVVDKTLQGVFLDWGIPKDLFVPISNQQYRMDVGSHYVVAIYTDNVTDRVVATTKLNQLVNNNEIFVREREEVDLLVAQRGDVGYRAVVNGKNWGILYHNQLFQPIEIGQKLRGYVNRITEDNRIDIMLQKEGFDQVKVSADKLLALLEKHQGVLYLTDKSSPEEVYAATQMSKKVFKKSVGYLLKRAQVTFDEKCIKIKK